MAAAVVSVDVIVGQSVDKNQIIAVIESMKMQTAITAPVAGIIENINVSAGQTI
jgi:acetyl-CoA/propionyl-CoA carboxylase biotin carboxyl carrier protein